MEWIPGAGATLGEGSLQGLNASLRLGASSRALPFIPSDQPHLADGIGFIRATAWALGLPCLFGFGFVSSLAFMDELTLFFTVVSLNNKEG